LTYFGGDLSTVLIPIGVLAVMTVVFFVFAVARFEYD
jgi:hypothetical protein